MKMKNYLKVFFSLALLFSLGSCSSEKEQESVSGQGSIMVDLSTSLSYKSRSIDESAYQKVTKLFIRINFMGNWMWNRR